MTVAQIKKRGRSPGRPPIPAPDIEALSFSESEPIELQVYTSLRRALMSGAMLPGSRVSSRSIASSLGISTMPVREALKRLESDGALKSSAKSAFIIPFPTVREFEEILHIRLRLETLLAQQAVPLITDTEVDKVEWLQDRMAQSKSWRQVLNYNQQMHFNIYRAAGMPYALSLIENVWTRIGPLLHFVFDGRFETTTYEHHYTIIEGLRERDAQKVDDAIRNDLLDAATVITSQLTAQPLL